MALDIFETFATDEAAEDGGVWVNLNAESSLLIARDGNDACERMVEELMLEYADKLAGPEDVSREAQRMLEIKVTAATILKGWKNLTYQGEAVDYSVENAEKLLAHKDFRRRVLYHARQRSAYMLQHEESVAKN